MFAPPPPTPHETVSTPSTAFRGTFPPHDQSPPQWTNIAAPLNGTKPEETSIVRQVSLRQRSARLSFLPGRRQQESDQPSQVEKVNGSPESKASHSRSRSFGKGGRRQSLFKSQSMDEGFQEDTNGMGRRGSSASRSSLDQKNSIEEHVSNAEIPVAKRQGSVRKRLSLFKLGKSNKTGGIMGSVDEE